MSGPARVIRFTEGAAATIENLRQRDPKRHKKVQKALRNLRDHGQDYPGLRTHRYQTVPGANGQAVWQSYIENKTPSAWRMWWHHGPGSGEITILSLASHP